MLCLLIGIDSVTDTKGDIVITINPGTKSAVQFRVTNNKDGAELKKVDLEDERTYNISTKDKDINNKEPNTEDQLIRTEKRAPSEKETVKNNDTSREEKTKTFQTVKPSLDLTILKFRDRRKKKWEDLRKYPQTKLSRPRRRFPQMAKKPRKRPKR